MRLTYVVLVATAAILVCCDGVSTMSDSKHLAVPQSRVQTQVNNRFLRVLQEVADEEGGEKKKKVGGKEEEEERAAPQLAKSLSGKFLANAAEKVSSKLTRSKSLNELSKLDDAYYIKALKTIKKAIYQRGDGAYLHIEKKMGLDPDGMLLMMKEMNTLTTYEKKVLLREYTKYWVAKYPDWTSKLAK